MITRSDAELVHAVREGDVRAFDTLVERHERTVFAVTCALARDAVDAADLAQEAFVRSYRNLDMLADPRRFASWVQRLAIGVAIDWMRASRPDLYRAAGEDEAVEDDGALRAAQAAERVEELALADRVRVALARLPARSRAPIALYHVDGMSHARVAAVLGVPMENVRELMARARHTLAHAPELAQLFEDEAPRTARALHVLNGDSLTGTLRQAGVGGELAVWADVLHEGPLPRNASAEQWRRARARYASSRGYLPYDQALAMYEAWDRGLASASTHDEVILWFEHDLFDQALLIHHLHYFSDLPEHRRKLSLVCVGSYPGVERFIGLGQLTATQLASLYGTRQRVTDAQIQLGRDAWAAYCDTTPAAIEQLLAQDTSALPFLAGALRRHLEEFPSTRTGLPRTERQVLELLARRTYTPTKLFIASQGLEERPYLGDTSFWWRVQRLAEGPDPLVALDLRASPQSLPEGEARISHAGLRVLAGEDDWLRLLPFDRRIGGVRVRGAGAHWRWDADAGHVVEVAAAG